MRPGQGLAWIKEKMPICSIRLTCATFQTVMMRKLKTGNVISRFVFKLKARRSNKIWIKCKTDNFLYFIISVSSNGSWGYARVSGIAHESLTHAKIYIYMYILCISTLYWLQTTKTVTGPTRYISCLHYSWYIPVGKIPIFSFLRMLQAFLYTD